VFVDNVHIWLSDVRVLIATIVQIANKSGAQVPNLDAIGFDMVVRAAASLDMFPVMRRYFQVNLRGKNSVCVLPIPF
jgi:hypothetical protein